MRHLAALFLLGLFLLSPASSALPRRDEGAAPPEVPLSTATFQGLGFRSLGPALTSGRVVDFAVNPHDRGQYYVAVASGGVWKTLNAGTTYTPVFDDQHSYSIGCVELDPHNPSVVWVGTGENNSQRSVGYGDGVYRSDDGGRSWKNMGLRRSEHIGRILVDPRHPGVVYAAAQGPLWGPGGDRGLYKTTDGGQSWKAVLVISENTGVSDIAFDPRDPDVLYAAAYQRRRHVWTLIDGGPESALFKSTDAGATWAKLSNGFPTDDMGRIGIAVSPVDPDVVFAVVEAANKSGGFFRSTDRGATWEKRSDYTPGGPMYYNRIFCDPKATDRVYSMDVMLMVTDDAGKTFRQLGERFKHVDNHAMWIDPVNTSYYLVGCDGGIYESFDRGATWCFKSNLPVTQFYRVTVDNARPFYNVFGGTQDNFSLGGPSRTTSATGIINADWSVTVGGDGFTTAVDPVDPNIIYSQSQYGGLVRYDKRSGELIGIKPQEGKGETPLRWNWDSPLIISSHSHTRLYFAANRLFRSEDRGDSWTAVSPDLTRQIDRNRLPVMGRVWPADAVAKNASTSFYGNITALAESPLRDGLLVAGTDDGLIQTTEDGGEHWRATGDFPGVPDGALVSCVLASRHDPERLYAAFDNHKMADFNAYILRSTDGGHRWESVKGTMPDSGVVYTIAEDHVKGDLLFAGTEFGVSCTVDGGRHWIRLKGGLPTIAVRDLALQRRENDLVLGTFGRGFYVLDDYAPLREVTGEMLEAGPLLMRVRDALMYIESTPLGLSGKAFQGETMFAAHNPPLGALFTYYLKSPPKTLKQMRQEAEKEILKKGEVPPYPTPEQLRKEDDEEAPAILLTVTDEAGNVVRRITGPAQKGFNRAAWSLRYAPTTPAHTPLVPPEDPFVDPDPGRLAMPGTYQVTLSQRVNGVESVLGGPQAFKAVVLSTPTLPAADRVAMVEFQRKVGLLQRAVTGAGKLSDEVKNRMELLKRALHDTPGAPQLLRTQVQAAEAALTGIIRGLRGDRTLRERNENTLPSVEERVQSIVDDLWQSTSAPTKTHQQVYRTASEEFAPLLARLRQLVETDLQGVERAMERLEAPWTPGRVPDWKPE
jgi:photosystem II stability/assembly factor-like uncharacterized protein